MSKDHPMPIRENKRKHVRRPLTYAGHIDAGGGAPAHECVLTDVSENGAQIVVASAVKLPENFILTLGFKGTARRRCQVIWRSEDRIGVSFVPDSVRPNANAAAKANASQSSGRGEKAVAGK
jgi:hypothetical protein